MSMHDLEDIYELSPMQQGILFHSQLFADGAHLYAPQLACVFQGPLNPSAFASAWRHAVEMHGVLRTSIHWEGVDKPLQVVHRDVAFDVHQEDWRGLSPAEQQERVESFLRDDRERGFDLAQAPLIRVSLLRLRDDAWQFVWSHHHLLLDGWSVSLVLGDVFAAYESLSHGRQPSLACVRPFADYIEWLQQQPLEAAEPYWRRVLAGLEHPTPLPADRSVSGRSAGNDDVARMDARLPAGATCALQCLGREHQITLNAIFQGAWAMLLSRYANESDVVFGVSVSGRPPQLAGFESMIGLFINTVAARVRTSPDESLLDGLKRLHDEQVEMRQFEHSPLVEVQGWSGLPRGTPLFESILAFENYPIDAASMQRHLGELRVSDFRQAASTNYPLILVVAPAEELLLRFVYDRRRFEPATISRMLGQLQVLLRAIVDNPRQRLGDVPLLTEAERTELVVDLNRTEPCPSCGPTILTALEAQAQRTPDDVAVVFGEERLSYRELHQRANRLAHYLRRQGAAPGTLVGICLERGPKLAVSLLAVLKAGCAYVPIDPAYPQERIVGMLADARTSLLVTEACLAAKLTAHGQTVCLDGESAVIERESDVRPELHIDPAQRIYAIFTSGSTGRPKLAAVRHAGFANLLSWFLDEFGICDSDRVLVVSSFTFDLTQKNFYAPLMTGGRLVFPVAAHYDPDEMRREIAEQGITLLNCTPSAFYPLVEQVDERQWQSLASLRRVFLGGEPILPSRFQRWSEWHQGRTQIVNTYGPTECTDICAAYRLEAPEEFLGSQVPTGTPIPGAQLYVLDSGLQLLPRGAAGELYIGGAGVGDGYANDPSLTASRFLPDPFSSTRGARLYKTGDLVRWLPNGNLDYQGRADHQVKIRGFRVELGEIEMALGRHASIRQAVVTVREDTPGDKRLVAYVLPHDGKAAAPGELRRHLEASLPDYMVPAAFVTLEAFPLSPNGKVDRGALPAPDGARPDLEGDYVAPRTALEQLLAGMWSEILSLDRVGAHDNFFELGGNSIQGAQLVHQLQERMSEFVYVVALFDAPTVANLAEYLEQHFPDGVARLCGTESAPATSRPAFSEDQRIDAAKQAAFRRLIEPLPARNGNAGPKNPRAVIVLSPPRSGSTLLRVMLGGHPRLFAPPELELLSFNTLADRSEALSGRFAFWMEGALRAVMEIEHCDVDAARRIVDDCERRGFTVQQFYRWMQERIGGRMLVDKTPTYALDIEVLRRAEADFQEPLYLHLIRHPCGMIRSLEEVRLDQVFFRTKHDFTTRQFGELVWLTCHQNIVEFLRDVPAHRQHAVRFEDLVSRPEAATGQLCEFLGLDMDPSMLEPYRDKERRMTDGLHSVSRMIGDVKFHTHSGINAQVADRWKEEYPEEALGQATRELAKAFGYGRQAAANFPAARSAPAPAIPRRGGRQILKQIDQLSAEEVQALLSDRLVAKEV